jgi:hypothetical protein
LILGTLLSDSLKYYLRYSEPGTVTVSAVNAMTEKSLEALLGLLRFCHRAGAVTEREQTQVVQVREGKRERGSSDCLTDSQIVIDSLRETLRVFAEAKGGLTGWQGIALNPKQVRDIAQCLVSECSQWVERSVPLPLSLSLLTSMPLFRNYRRDDVVPGLEVAIILSPPCAHLSRSRRASGWGYRMPPAGFSKLAPLRPPQRSSLRRCCPFYWLPLPYSPSLSHGRHRDCCKPPAMPSHCCLCPSR